MFKSIFQKLLVTYLTIIIIGIAVLSIVVSLGYSRYVFDRKQAELERAGHNVNLFMNRLDRKEITLSESNAALDSLGYITDSRIYVIRLNAQSLDSSSNLEFDGGLSKRELLNDLRQILNGEKIFRQKQYSSEFDTYVVFSGIPWKTGQGIFGAILLFSPVSELNQKITRLNLIIWTTALILILLSALVIYYYSRRISKPIKDMEVAAGRLAAGNQTDDIIVPGRDEISSLAHSFNSMKLQLANTEKMRREFVTNVSHDMRTPLTSINGFVSSMLDGIVSPESYPKYLKIIKEETARLTLLTNEILELAKIQSGNLILVKHPVLVRKILECVLYSIQGILQEKSIPVHLKCDPTRYVYADWDKLKQVLINLLENAVKYSSPHSEIEIIVSGGSNGTIFQVKDNGVGIAAEDLPFIFEKFYQADKSRQATACSFGLGLNIAKNLIELHGGTIEAESTPGLGSIITFSLP